MTHIPERGPCHRERGVIEPKQYAIEVAEEIEGGNFRQLGIRRLVHDVSPERLNLVLKHIEEFESGRRHFVFERTNTPVPYSNYKMVMQYVIQSLRRGRENFYQTDPNYINKDTFERWSEGVKDFTSLSLNDFPSYREGEKYVFEWISRELLALEDEVDQALTDEEIRHVLKKFRKLYDHMPNHNRDITVCTCLDPSVFYESSRLKPVPRFLIKRRIP